MPQLMPLMWMISNLIIILIFIVFMVFYGNFNMFFINKSCMNMKMKLKWFW